MGEKLNSGEPQEQIVRPEQIEKPKKKTGISRRDFLRQALALGAVAVVESAVGAEKTEVKKKEDQKKSEKEKLIKEMEAMRRADFEFIKGIIESRQIEEKLEYIEDNYGDVINDNFLEVRKIVHLVKEIEQDIKDGKENIFVDKDKPTSAVKSSRFSYFRERWTDMTKEEKLKKAGNVKIIGFNKINEIFGNKDAEWQGDSDKKIGNLMAQRYPAQWLASTKEVVYKDELNPMPEEYGIKGFVDANAKKNNRYWLPEKGEITFYKTNSYNLEVMTEILDHELAHQNDWRTCNVLTEPQRIEFLCDVSFAFKDTREFSSDYVDSIKNKDKKIEAYNKVTEYWATAVEQYMTQGPENYKKTNPTEFALVKKWFDIINDIK